MDGPKRIKHEIVSRGFFNYSHLPEDLQKVSKPFHDIAQHLDINLRNSAEKTACLRNLLQSKDAAVRAALY